MIYAGGLICFLVGLFFPNRDQTVRQPMVSVVIAARNEEKTLPELLEDLKKQTYPPELCEFIVVDDHSEDRTADCVRSVSKEDDRFRLVEAKTGQSGHSAKKHALLCGIKDSRGEIILTTDADCRVLPTWMESMVSYFQPDVGMVIGFSRLNTDGRSMTLLEQLQALDFLSLMSAAQGSANLGFPLAASGQNLAYRKSAFDDAGGFEDIGHRVSGDDVLLLQRFRKHTSWAVRFAPSPGGFNTSLPESTLHKLLNQRKRWASNGAYQWKLNWGFFLYILNTFFFNLLLLIQAAISLFTGQNVGLLLIVLLIKFFVEGGLIAAGCRAYRTWKLMRPFILWTIIQVPYVVFVGLTGSVCSIEWKSRRYPGPGEAVT